ncbi:MAG TPA: cytochrome ubiquinol oxidase subunit I [Longimicrobiales bacterium]|jgi:cytochrome d ubiquinol oxidase subunit I
MDAALALHRFQFGFTAAFHYIFPQLTMGLVLLLVVFKTMGLRTGEERYHRAARFWARIFGIAFTVGVVTGIPLEFEFGTNWAAFSRAAGGVIGQTLAMEGMFAFFLESAFLGLFLFGEDRLSPRAHWLTGVLLLAGTWLSGYLIVQTNAWMQHPVGYALGPDGEILLESYWALLFNPWGVWQYAHTMMGSVVTGSVAVASIGAWYVLSGRADEDGRLFVRYGVTAGLAASILLIMPTGDMQGRNVAHHQPATLAAMEGLFETEEGAPLVIIGQPDVDRRTIDNPLAVPKLLSFLTYQRWGAEVRGLDAFPEDEWPDQIPLLYYAYHIMVGLGTIFVAVLGLAAFLLWRGRLFDSRLTLWGLMLILPFPFIANTAGWMTAELGRQPWVIYGLMRTADGASPQVSSGSVAFTLLGFMGMYTVLGLLFLYLVGRELVRGPGGPGGAAEAAAAGVEAAAS